MKAHARVILPNRTQMEFRASDLESLLPEGHRARLVWSYVVGQDLGRFYERIRVREGGVGRAAIAPEILLSLWLYATLDGVGSAREVARLTDAHDAYRWLCGGVQVNYHTLSDFRKDHGEALDELLSANVATLIAAGVVKLRQVAHDGMRVRASAGAGSFRREDKLAGYLEAARERVAQLKAELEADPGRAMCFCIGLPVNSPDPCRIERQNWFIRARWGAQSAICAAKIGPSTAWLRIRA